MTASAHAAQLVTLLEGGGPSVPAEYRASGAVDAWLRDLSALVREHAALTNCHINEFFSERELVPAPWLEALERRTVEELSQLVGGGPVPDGLPPSLVAHVEATRRLSAARTDAAAEALLRDAHARSAGAACPQLDAALRLGVARKKQYEVHTLSAAVSVVVEACSRQGGSAAAQQRATVIDWGAGAGYLACECAWRHTLRCAAVDAVPALAAAVNERNAVLAAARARCGASADGCAGCAAGAAGCACGVGCLLPFSAGAPRAALDAIVRDAFGPAGSEGPLVLCALHACGDLSAGLLRTYIAAAADEPGGAAAGLGLVSVACCYNLLTEPGDGGGDGSDGSDGDGEQRQDERATALGILERTAAAAAAGVARRRQGHEAAGDDPSGGSGTNGGALAGGSAAGLPDRGGREADGTAPDAAPPPTPPGFPLSSAGQQLWPTGLGRSARLLACQSAPRWAAAGTGAGLTPAALRGQLMRAALQALAHRCGTRPPRRLRAQRLLAELVRRDGDAPDEQLFVRFAAAVARGSPPADGAAAAQLWRDCAAPARRLPAFLALRALLADPLESLVQADRLLAVREALGARGHAGLLPVFDPVLSPRNLAVVAVRA